MRFLYDKVGFIKHSYEEYVRLRGEITNLSGRDFNAVFFRILLFVRTRAVANITITIRGFPNGQTKTFDEPLPDLDPDIVPIISKYEIYPESTY